MFAGAGGYVNAPLIAGVALSWSPIPGITLTPSSEFHLALYGRARARDVEVGATAAERGRGGRTVKDGDTVRVRLSADDVTDLMTDATDWGWGYWYGWRSALTLKAEMGSRAELNLRLATSPVESAGLVTWFGITLAIRWDDIVPGAQPSGERTPGPSDRKQRAKQRKEAPFGPPPTAWP